MPEDPWGGPTHARANGSEHPGEPRNDGGSGSNLEGVLGGGNGRVVGRTAVAFFRSSGSSRSGPRLDRGARCFPNGVG